MSIAPEVRPSLGTREVTQRGCGAGGIVASIVAFLLGGCTGIIETPREQHQVELADAAVEPADASLASTPDAAPVVPDATPLPPPDAAPFCGDGICRSDENCSSCPQDCGACVPVCGDGYCNPEENPWDCSGDCGMPAMPAGFAGVQWLHTNVSSWPEAAGMSEVTVSSSNICLNYDKANVWPGLDYVGAFVNANPWIFVYQDNTIYAATWEWMRHGQTCKSRTSVAGDHIKKSPLKDFSPRSGTVYGFMVSGLARDGTRNVLERTPVVFVKWP